jgi:7,8-dihydropterin-6-yl-methyl-4-(beta-D-ribofuranosyl)aminobenzene 5'-phosphate synthase
MLDLSSLAAACPRRDMRFKITTLSENYVAQSGKNLIGEHGLSFYIETERHRILFDTGQNLALANNASVLGVELSQIDSVVLSHGHYDHTGGLKSLLQHNKNFALYGHPDVFSRKVKGADDEYKYIGIPIEKKEIENRGIALKLTTAAEKIVTGIMTTGEIPLKNDFEQVESGFFIQTQTGPHLEADTLADDQALILDTGKGIVVLLGCSHRGVINTLNRVADLSGKNKIHAILGGLHLGKTSDLKLKKMMDHLHAFGLQKIGVGHCTGYRAILALSNEFKDRVFLDTVGNVMEF